MSKARREDPEIADEYDFSNAVRGKYAEQMKDGYTVQIVSDEKIDCAGHDWLTRPMPNEAKQAALAELEHRYHLGGGKSPPRDEICDL